MRTFIISLVIICLLFVNAAISSDIKKIALKQERTSVSVKNDSREQFRVFNSLSDLEFVEIKTKAGVFTKLVIEGYTNKGWV